MSELCSAFRSSLDIVIKFVLTYLKTMVTSSLPLILVHNKQQDRLEPARRKCLGNLEIHLTTFGSYKCNKAFYGQGFKILSDNKMKRIPRDAYVHYFKKSLKTSSNLI